jgi:hypothetical protein
LNDVTVVTSAWIWFPCGAGITGELTVLKETVMPRLAKDITKVQKSCAIIIHDSSDISKGPRKAYLGPKSIIIEMVVFLDGSRLQFYTSGKPDPITLPFLSQSPIARVKLWKPKVKKVVPNNFYAFYIGDSLSCNYPWNGK